MMPLIPVHTLKHNIIIKAFGYGFTHIIPYLVPRLHKSVCSLHTSDPADQRVETLLRKSIALLEDQVNNEMASEDLEFYYYNLGTTLLGRGTVKGVVGLTTALVRSIVLGLG